MNHPTPIPVVTIGDHGMQHLVVHHVLEKPRGDKLAVEQGMNADDPIILLDRTEDDGTERTLLASAPPNDRVTFKPVAEVLRVQLIEDRAEVEKATLLRKSKLLLHRQLWRGKFAFGPAHG